MNNYILDEFICELILKNKININEVPFSLRNNKDVYISAFRVTRNNIEFFIETSQLLIDDVLEILDCKNTSDREKDLLYKTSEDLIELLQRYMSVSNFEGEKLYERFLQETYKPFIWEICRRARRYDFTVQGVT